ncbi:IspD/TarI family cytidylyltransferase [Entomospira entomophila]|uniref:2-C-methyl-D-erythritol 4-phosphate cytidylyltransferase n=1 Tax=Entomospira entomophila TaxID=2719988 RepID=A0A968G7S4_9SPIO|nr:IspD/TarI family cytidylyltransferase [Entomospira entomophilus]NIZ40160.1 2-C-methyl-D-erythritol 4-phosphate cytidylyltransferase [Entomospira entomophilus]WDI35718.1 IspD/TarI family cytidylyltransferase [Entomospira entomophilus]
MRSKKTVFILLAGGNSSRMGGTLKKEIAPLSDGVSALERIVSVVNTIPEIDHLQAVYHADYHDETKRAIQQFTRSSSLSPAGGTRQESVAIALNALSEINPFYVLIHDGARPWVDADLILRIMHQLVHHDAVVPVIPVTDSLKRVNQQGMIIEECRREEYALAQTPQAFRFEKIWDVHQRGKHFVCTDDVSLYSMVLGEHAITVEGDVRNKKITYQGDIL